MDAPAPPSVPGAAAATVTIITAHHVNVLRVPNAALRFRPTSASGERPARAGGGRAGGGAGGAGPGGGGGAGGGGGGAGGPPGAGGGRAGGGAGRSGAAPAAGGHGRIYILRNGNPAPVHVTVGISDGFYTEVSSPELQPGMEVVTDETDAAAGARGGRPGGAGGPGGRRVF